MNVFDLKPSDEEQRLLLDAIEFFSSHPVEDIALDTLVNPVIFAFSFGAGSGNSGMGNTNSALAEIISITHDALGGCEIFAQEEIAAELNSQYNSVSGDIAFIAEAKKSGMEYFNTQAVLDQFHNQGADQLDRPVILIAQPDHAFRCRFLVQNLGYRIVLLPQCFQPNRPWKDHNCVEWGYDPESSQPWTRKRHRFLIKELNSLIRDAGFA